MKSISRSVTSVQAEHWVNQPDATSREIHTSAESLTWEVMWVTTSRSRQELSGQENLVWNTDLIETKEFENLIGQAAQSPCSDEMRNESRGMRESRRFPSATMCSE